MSKIIKSYWPAITWSAIIFILLVIPGDDLPEETFLTKLHFDKWVHIGIFALFVSLWCWGVFKHQRDKKFPLVKAFIMIACTGLVFGYGMELVQKYFVQNRDYDLWDLLADGLGCMAGLIFSIKVYIKK